MQDGILPKDNLSDSLNSAWNDSNSVASSHGSSSSGGAGQLATTLIVPPITHSMVNVDVVISAATMQVSISIQGSDLANVFINDFVPRSIFTRYLSRYIMNVVAAYGPWSSGYGLPHIATQYPIPQITYDVTVNNEAVMVQFSPRIYDYPLAPSSVVITDITNENSINVTNQARIQELAILGTHTNSTEIAAVDTTTLCLAPTETSNSGLQQSPVHSTATSLEIGLAQVPSLDSARPQPIRGRRLKAQVPISTTEVQRSTRSTRYDGFRASQPTDTRSTASKVKPRIIPLAVQGSSSAIVQDMTAKSTPPPTPIQIMQSIGVNRCAVPSEELTDEALLGAPLDVNQTANAGTEEGSSSLA